MTRIAAIETLYKGYRFRSRLEARWAVYFDTLGVSWEYEKEGYDLGPRLGWYLPDFWLPDQGFWGEVKPTVFSKVEWAKCEALAEGAQKRVLMLDGSPMARNYWAFDPDFGLRDFWLSYAAYEDNGVHRFYYDTDYGASGVLECRQTDDPIEWFSRYIGNPNDHDIECICKSCDPRGAIAAARAARFQEEA